MRTDLLNRLSGLRGVRSIRRRINKRRGGHEGNQIYVGEFRSFDEARASIPTGRVVGYDNRELASWYRERLGIVQSEDYPVLFWLRQLLQEVSTVFDFGGHVGLHFYAWQRLLKLADGVRWTVCEVPAVVEAGRALALERKVDTQLRFATDIAEANGVGVFVASGSVQYLEPDFLWRSLGAMKQRPTHLLLNKFAVHDSRDFVTVQDTGASFHPYSVVSRPTLDSELKKLGYQQVDHWVTPGHECRVTLRPELDVPAFSGDYWKLG